jgi:hypothetical protein
VFGLYLVCASYGAMRLTLLSSVSKVEMISIRDVVEELAAEGALKQAPRGNYVIYKTAEKSVVPSRDDRDDPPSFRIGTTEPRADPTNVDIAQPKGRPTTSGRPGRLPRFLGRPAIRPVPAQG